MKLSNYIRDAFVRAAMDDVPQIDYDKQAADLVQADFVEQMPPKIKAMYRDKELRGWLGTETVCTPGRLSNVCVYGKALTVTPGTATKLSELSDSKMTQDKQRLDLKQRLRAAAYSVTTRKALVALLPEFEKYLPADEQAALRTVPVVANLVTDFVKARWPKGEKAA